MNFPGVQSLGPTLRLCDRRSLPYVTPMVPLPRRANHKKGLVLEKAIFSAGRNLIYIYKARYSIYSIYIYIGIDAFKDTMKGSKFDELEIGLIADLRELRGTEKPTPFI